MYLERNFLKGNSSGYWQMGWVHVFCKHMSDCQKKTFTFLCFMTYQISGFLFLSYFLCVWMVYLHICQYTMFIQYSPIQKRVLDALGLELQTLISLRIEAEREADALKHRSIFPVPEYPSLLLLIATTTDWSQWLSKYSRNHCLESIMISILYR